MSKLPISVRSIIFSFCDLITLIEKIQQLSKKDNALLFTCENLNQPKCLRINMKNQSNIQAKSLVKYLKMSNAVEISLSKFDESQALSIDFILYHISEASSSIQNVSFDIQLFAQSRYENLKKVIADANNNLRIDKVKIVL